MAREYIIYCDESEEKGRFYSNFYGGVLVRSQHFDEVKKLIAKRKSELNLYDEAKWNKITKNYAAKYIDLVDLFFDFVEQDKIKVRIMFTQNRFVPTNLTKRHVDEKYFILYYQFLKHAFGLQYSPKLEGGVRVRIYPDRLPDMKEQVEQFRSFVVGLTKNPDFRRVGLMIRPGDIADVNSHNHDLLQCLDIVLGAMHFRLNDKHREKPNDSSRRAKRTIAKEKVFTHISRRIRRIYPNFNIGTTTGLQNDITNRWNHSYRHWLFMPTHHEIREGTTKGQR